MTLTVTDGRGSKVHLNQYSLWGKFSQLLRPQHPTSCGPLQHDPQASEGLKRHCYRHASPNQEDSQSHRRQCAFRPHPHLGGDEADRGHHAVPARPSRRRCPAPRLRDHPGASAAPIGGNTPARNGLSRSWLLNACLMLPSSAAQKIQTNREGCYRLAQRCLAMLVDIRDHMSDRWDSAPPSLLKAISRFEE